MTEQDLKRIQEAMREAEKDNTPFQIIDGNGEMSVIGDVNKTEFKTYSYTVRFRVPAQFASMIPDGVPIIGGKYVVADVEYPNVYISSRKDIKLIGCLNDLRPFLIEVLPDGETRDRDEVELTKIILNSITNGIVLNAMYEFVGTAIGVDEALVPMMMYDSVFKNFVQLIKDFPELINEQDFFTAESALNKGQTEQA